MVEVLSDIRPDDRAIRGRGAVSNRVGRFERYGRQAFDDGWALPGPPTRQEDAEQRPDTTLVADASRRILTTNNSPDVPFDRSINPYQGCEHGCIYCFARPTHTYWGLSAGLDFERRLIYKPNAADLLRAELAKPGYRPETVALGANTDPYQPVERDLGITRAVLEVLAEARHPVTIVTKSALVTRDIDLLKELARWNAVRVCMSVTTLDRRLARLMEPRAPRPSLRTAAIRQLTEAGIPTAVLASPMIPGLNDAELEAILVAGHGAGARHANTILVRLPLEISELFREWLEAHYPDRARRVMNLIRQCRDGAVYQSRFGERMKGSGPYADLLQQRFKRTCRQLGLATGADRYVLETRHFRAPDVPGRQFELF